ncbi:hypothetical protein BZA77DRAFT_344068 [Pyronema omphalodes]|nr:hypothetical protein BZA77DRAFT_344068 [Pyronema omphalodes]
MTNSHIHNTNLLTFLRQRILILSPSSWTPPSYILTISSADISSTAEAYTTPQLTRLILSILLGLPPFQDYPDENISSKYGAFLNHWKTYISGSFPEQEDEQEKESVKTVEEDSSSGGGGYQDFSGLDILISLRFEFSQLSGDRFVFISRLLLACLRVLKVPELNPTDRIEILQKATSILEKLMGSIPNPKGVVTEKQANSVVGLWRCLMLLTDRAQWWAKNRRFKEGLLRLAKCVFALPNCIALFKLTLKADISSKDVPEVHNVVTILLSALETHLGIPTDASINAFTPYPFTFPLTNNLDNFNWTNDYNFANLRVMAAAWLLSENQDLRKAGLDAPGTNARVVLEHTSGFERLIRYPESALRVALVHISNETRSGGKARPLADKKAIEALAKYDDYARKQKPARGQEFKGYFELAEWLLPWLWRRRGIDQMFVWKTTVNWMQRSFVGDNELVEVEESHPAIELMEKQNMDLLFPVFDANEIGKDIFRRVIRAAVFSIEDRWMSAASLHTACVIMLHVTKKTIFDSMAMVNMAMQLQSIHSVILECIDDVRDAYQKTSVDIPSLENTLETLTSVTQFAIIILVADPQLVSSFATKGLRQSIHHLITTSKQFSPLSTEISSVCIASLAELLSLIDFPGDNPESQTDLKFVLLKTFESPHPAYHIPITTSLILSIPPVSWLSHPLDYLNSWYEIREIFLAETSPQILLQAYLPCLVRLLPRLISQPNQDLRQALLIDRLNIELCKKLLLEILMLQCQADAKESSKSILICGISQETQWREELASVATKKELKGIMETLEGEEREWVRSVVEVLGVGGSGKVGRKVEVQKEEWWYWSCNITVRGMGVLVRI